jgi:membrane-associated phospholipid phosphatase
MLLSTGDKKTMVLDTIKRYWNLRYGHIRFRLMDICCLTYMALIGFLLIFFHKTVTNWSLYVFIHAAIVISILEIVRLGEKYPDKKILLILRMFYPIAIMLYGWEELEILVPMFFGSYWATDMIVSWDKLIFGVHPTIWVQQFYQPWLNELMNFFYVAYYPFFILIPLSLLVYKKKQEVFAVFSMACFTYFTNFFLFYLLPTLDPYNVPILQALQIKQQTGYLFVEINRIVQARAGIITGAFPSSHIAGALVWVLAALRYNRKLGYVLAPVIFGMGFSVVYTGLHHAVDPIFGYIWGAACYLIALKLIKKRGEDPLTASEKPANPC